MSARRDMGAAMRAYVQGHDRVRPRAMKLASEGPETERPPEFGPAPSRPTFGVPVPERLRFHRGPATWRDRASESGTSGDG